MKFTNKPAQSIAQKPEAQTPAKAKKSRKRITNKGYSAAVYTRLFEYVASGEDLTTACRHSGMPTPWTVRRRLAVDDPLADQFKRANQIRLQGVADELLRLPDEALEGKGEPTRAEKLTAAKLKSENIKWVAQRMLAEYAGDGEGGGTVTLNIIGAPDAPPAPAGTPGKPYVPPGQPVLKIVGGPAQSIAQDGEQGND